MTLGKRRMTTLLIVITLTLSFTACSKQELADRRGEMLFYDQDELTDGFYIRNEDGTFTPVMHGAEGYGGMVLESSLDRYLWFTENTLAMKSLIPVLNKKTELVAVFSDDSAMPPAYTLEKYKERGYTIGVKFYKDGTRMYFKTRSDDICSDSQIGMGITGTQNLPAEVVLSEFNEKSSMPFSSIDQNLNMLLGLKENGKYQIGFYVGTYFMSKEAIADTLVFQSEQIYQLTSPFKKTKEGYFVVKMPETVGEGYYYICDAGLLYYDK